MNSQFILRLFVFISFLNCSITVYGQDTWTLKMAIDTAIQNNLGFQIARNEAHIAANTNSAGAAGMLPRANISAITSVAENDIRQEFRTGEVLATNGVKATNTVASAQLSWTIFDGFRMFATKDRLKVLEDLGELRVKQQLVSLIAQTARTFFYLQRQQLLVKSSKVGLSLYEERVRIAQKKLELGSSPRTEYLQAAVDYNEQLSLLTARQTILETTRVQLNGILMHSITDSIVVTDSINDNEAVSYESLLSKLEQNNLDIKEQLLLQDVVKHELRELKSGYYPLLDVNAGYNYNKSTTSQGFFLENRSMGPTAGLSFNWNLFNGMNVRREMRNSIIVQENSRLTVEQMRMDINVALRTAWLNYSSAMQVYSREQESNKLAIQNLDIMSERFRLNESTVLELKGAQQTREDAQSRLANSYYEVRIAMVELQQLTGGLL